jgi:hypothetical protein
MLRAISVTTVLVAAMATVLLGQGRNRDFGMTADMTCDDVRDSRRDVFCEIREETLSGSVLNVDASPNGGIRVRGWDRGETLVRARVVAYARSDADARALASEVRVTTSGGRVRADGPDNNRRNENWAVSFDVQVPQNAQLDLTTVNGGITIYDFSGTARFQARNGGVSLAEVGGDIRGETVNGGVSVELSGERWNGAGLDVETRNGGVRMLVPSNYSAQLETGTVNGGLRIDFPVTVQGLIGGRRVRNINTTLGSGGPRIRAITTNGGVSIVRR